MKNKLTQRIALLLASLSVMTACGTSKQKVEQPKNESNTEQGKGTSTVEEKKDEKKEEKKETVKETSKEEKKEVVKKVSKTPKVAEKEIKRNVSKKLVKKVNVQKHSSNEIEEAKKRQRDLLVAREKEEAQRKLVEQRKKEEEKARQEARKQEEAKKRAEEEARKAEEARKRAEEEKKRAEEEAKKKEEEKAKEEARKRAEEEARKLEEQKRKEEEAKKKAEEEKRKAEEAKKKAEEEAKKRAEEEKKLAEQLANAKKVALESINKLSNIDKGAYANRINNATSVNEIDSIVAAAIDESQKNTTVIDEDAQKKLAELKAYRENAIKVINELKNIDAEKQGFINEINVEENTENIDKIVKRAEDLSAQKTKEIEEAITEIIEEETETITTPMETIETTSDDLEEGKTQVTEGQDGIKEVTYKLTYNSSKKNGKVLVSKEVIKEEVKQEMKKRIVIKGTKKVQETKLIESSELRKIVADAMKEVRTLSNKNLGLSDMASVVSAKILFNTVTQNAIALINSKEKITEAEFNETKAKVTAALNEVKLGYQKAIEIAEKMDKNITVRMSDTENTTVKGHYEEELAQQHINIINSYRTDNNAKALIVDSELMNIARLRAAEITKNFAHTRVDGKSLDTLKKYLGENIAMTSGNATPTDVFEQFKDSPGHNKNMLKKDYARIGVAMFRLRVEMEDGKVEYNTYTVQIFELD